MAEQKKEVIVALGGNPNVGKSTLFNQLTGMKQHTGNWSGKTVSNAEGRYQYGKNNYLLIDIPGTYSLFPNSPEEEIARDFLCFGNADVTVLVADATCLERNLHFVLQVREMVSGLVLCVNLMDEAKKKGVFVNLKKLSELLNIPVVGTSARSKKGLDRLCLEIEKAVQNPSAPQPLTYDEETKKLAKTVSLPDSFSYPATALRVLAGEPNFRKQLSELTDIDYSSLPIFPQCREKIVDESVRQAEKIYEQCVMIHPKKRYQMDRKLDRIFTSKQTGIPVMILLLGIILWITMKGANYPSDLLSSFLFSFEQPLKNWLQFLPTPLQSMLVDGVYRTLAWVTSVMLPPMAIFFPLFTLLEDFGYLPRIAFNLDHLFCKAKAHGKQALTMCMGFGCNACGVTGCRIIDSPRERLIAVLTNCFVPCNGKFPTLVALIFMFTSGNSSFLSSLALTASILLGIGMTLLISRLLSSTILKGVPSSFVLELPPYRKPQFGQVIVRSVFDRTLFVLGRAILIAAPSGAVIWLMANCSVNQTSLLNYCTEFFTPFASYFGIDGVILLSFLLGFPANEIVIPIMLMSYLSTGKMVEYESLTQLKALLIENGWTIQTAVSTLLLCLFHFPCGTTCQTIYKETKSIKWTVLAIILPTLVGLSLCFILNLVMHL